MADSAGRYAKSSLASLRRDWLRRTPLLAGAVLFLLCCLSPAWPTAVDPQGRLFELTFQGKAALGLFLLAAVWWIFETVPIGVTGIAVGALQVLLGIRETRAALTDFMDPAIWFIMGSLIIGIVFAKSGLSRRFAYGTLMLVGERTRMIYLGCFGMIAGLTLVMAHTAAAATVFPMLMAVYSLYPEGDKPTRFGKGLFIGMAFTAGAASIITLLGSARAAASLALYYKAGNPEVGFFELSWYTAPPALIIIALIWLTFIYLFRPERDMIPGLHARAKMLYAKLGPVSTIEKASAAVILVLLATLCFQPLIPGLSTVDKSGPILAAIILFFALKILSIKDLEDLPWNIMLLFGGALSLGFCLWDTGAAQWLGVHCLNFFRWEPRFVFLLLFSASLLAATNVLMNAATLALFLPVGLVVAPYLGISPMVILFVSLISSGMPFLFLVGAAPNAIAFESRQFTTGEFLKTGLAASVVVLLVLALFTGWLWPLMGMAR